MADTNWLRQTTDKPLFPDILWSRPENRRYAGKLLIMGGNMHGFAAPAAAYAAADKAGIGVARVLLPDKLQRSIGKLFPEAVFAPSTQVGSFSKKASATAADEASWADGVLLAGDFDRNSETAVVLESLTSGYRGPLVVAQDALQYFWGPDTPILERETSCYVVNLGKLQKLAKNNRPGTPVLHSMNLYDLVRVLEDWTKVTSAAIITRHSSSLVVAYQGQVSTTPYGEELRWQVELAAYAAVWMLQQPDKLFEAITTAVYCYVHG